MVSLSALILRIGIFVVIFLLIDWYVFQGVRVLDTGVAYRKFIHLAYWGVTAVFLLLLGWVLVTFDRTQGPGRTLFMFLAGFFVLIWVPKLVFAFVLLTEDLLRLLKAVVCMLSDLVSSQSLKKESYMDSRRQFFSQVGLVLAAIPFAGILYGITKGKYHFFTRNLILTFPDLPDAFDGLRLAQISDIHSGSFDSMQDVTRGIEMIKQQKPDLIVFTGDLVNNIATEVEPYIGLFKTMEAPFGKFSVLGNHDYGDYVPWKNPSDKNDNLQKLKEHHKEIGFRLLMNESVSLERNGQKIVIAGVENWGLPPFPQKGDLHKALNGVKSEDFTILLSHDPTHWDAKVLPYPKQVHLTLSGHTHGMQFGIEIPGWRWSPVKYRYKRWLDLYQETNRYLYVNRGFGFLAFPGRVGIFPEITIITLKKQNS